LLAVAGFRTPDRPDRSLVAILTTLYWLLPAVFYK